MGSEPELVANASNTSSDSTLRPAGARRFSGFWHVFNKWHRTQMANGARPSCEMVRAWYVDHAATVWETESQRPTLQETLVHGNGLRSADEVKKYNRNYKARKVQKKPHQISEGSPGSISCSDDNTNMAASHAGEPLLGLREAVAFSAPKVAHSSYGITSPLACLSGDSRISYQVADQMQQSSVHSLPTLGLLEDDDVIPSLPDLMYVTGSVGPMEQTPAMPSFQKCGLPPGSNSAPSLANLKRKLSNDILHGKRMCQPPVACEYAGYNPLCGINLGLSSQVFPSQDAAACLVAANLTRCSSLASFLAEFDVASSW